MKPKLKRIPAGIILIILSRLEKNIIPKIKDQRIEDLLLLKMNPLKDTVKALSDADPNDAEQIKQIIHDFISSDELVEYQEDRLMELVLKIEDESVRKSVSMFIPLVTGITKALTDDVKPDGEQIKNLVIGFIKSDAIEGYLLDDIMPIIIKKLVKDEDYAEFVIGLIKEASELID